MDKDIVHYTDFDEWVKDVRHAGGDVLDRTHDSLNPLGNEFFAMGWDGEFGNFNKSTNTGYLFE